MSKVRMNIASGRGVVETGAPGLSRRQVLAGLLGVGALPVIALVAPDSARADPPCPVAELDEPLADTAMSDLSYQSIVQIAGPSHRVNFLRASWIGSGGQPASAIVRDIEVHDGSQWVTVSGPGSRLDEQWRVVSGDSSTISAGDYTQAANLWLALGSVTKLSASAAELTAEIPGVLDLTVRWDVSGTQPEVQWSLHVQSAGTYVVGYHATPRLEFEAVDEVLCGALQHARSIGSSTALFAWELFAPMALLQTEVDNRTLTTGVYVPGDVMAFEHERFLGWDDQPFAMSLRNAMGQIQASVYAPPGGLRSELAADESVGYVFGVVASLSSLYEAQVSISRDSYGLTRYRRNVYDTSLTASVHNMLDLVAVEPDGDDSVDFVPSVSGWWNRAKGFANIEADQQTRTATSSVLASAALVACGPQDAAWLWEHRARPQAEYNFSRRSMAHSPKHGFGADAPLGGYAFDACSTVPMWQMTRGESAGFGHIARLATAKRRWPNFVAPLSAHLLTQDPGWLAEAKAVADIYIEDRIFTPSTTNHSEVDFSAETVEHWLELVVLHDLTGEQRYLDAAHAEAKRYMGAFDVRPVPEGTVLSPVGAPIDDAYYKWVTSPGIPNYPRAVPPTETVEKWMVSTTGLTYEQLRTFKTEGDAGGFTLNAVWAPFLLRLAHLVGDDFIRDMTHNMVIGRFSNYPGYYNRQFVSWPMHPDYPLEGPSGTSAIYYHHIPAQIGLAIDYLISEHQTRSDGEIVFPYAWESTFAYFTFHTYGHQPGTFYGDDGVWPYFPQGIIAVDNAQLNWLTAVGTGRFYLSLTNATGTVQTAHVDFDAALTGIEPDQTYSASLIVNGASTAVTIAQAAVDVTVPGHGIAALVIDVPDVPSMPWQRGGATDWTSVSYHLDDIDGGGTTLEDKVYGVTIPRPDRRGYDIYIQSSIPDATPMSLRYRVDDGAWVDAPAKTYPREWTFGVEDLRSSFSYVATVDGVARDERTLYLPGFISGGLPHGQTVGGELRTDRGSSTPGDAIDVTVVLRNETDVDLDGVTAWLGVPSGWTKVDPTVPTTIPANSSLELPAAVTPGPYSGATGVDRSITGRIRWSGGSKPLASLVVQHLTAMKLLDVSASPAAVTSLTDDVTIRTSILNRGAAAATGTATLTLPTGWTANETAVTWSADPRSWVAVTMVATPTAAPFGDATLMIQPGGGLPSRSVQVSVGTRYIVANGDTAYSETGTWLASSLEGYDGIRSRYSPESQYGGTATFTPTIADAADYEVSVWYPTNPDTTTDALYTVTTPDGSTDFHVDQTQGADGWRVLGTFALPSGTDSSVTLTAITGLVTRVSAVRFQQAS
ncbi:NEW3 domain-containing protein [Occultella kanbiaonis]|uniref:golvesin C-terminal-like domain-containing protein n=1 Tax=Occultella kanbiaonis TaxID=2675754 RepID=UPI0012B6CC53|nr:NEW3 domain-containing protein [Occultella kanbiaonis]